MASDLNVHASLCSFSNKLYEALIKQEKGGWKNTFMSPLSVYATMSMLLFGSRGTTKKEMLDALQMSEAFGEEKSLNLVGKTLLNYFKSTEHVELNFANRLFAAMNGEIESDFKANLLQSFEAETENVDFVGNAEVARNRINSWVKTQTKEKITELLPGGSVGPDTSIILVNALYFKGLWENPFDKRSTRTRKFHKLDGSIVDLKFMYAEKNFSLTELCTLNARAIKIPFLKSNWEMLIVLPNENAGLPGLVEKLIQPNGIDSVLRAHFNSENVELYLPRFKIGENEALDVASLLKMMGLEAVFSASSADLTGICSSPKLYVSDVKHKAILEVDEEGAVAAAATSVAVNLCCCLNTPVFCVDHPFFVAIIREGKVPVFLGHVTCPESF